MATVTGSVPVKIGRIDAATGALYPVVQVELRGRDGRSVFVDAVLDTGFTGTISIPIGVIRELGIVRRRRETFVLADGSTSESSVYDGSVRFAGSWFETDIFSTHYIPTVGMRLLYGANISFDAVPDGDIEYRSLDLPRPRWPLHRR